MVVTSIENNFKHGTQPDYVFLSNLYYVYEPTVWHTYVWKFQTILVTQIRRVRLQTCNMYRPNKRFRWCTFHRRQDVNPRERKKDGGKHMQKNELSSRSSLPVTEILATLPRAGNRSCYYAQLHLPRIKSRDRTYVHRFRFSRATGFVNERLLEKGPERDYASVITDRRTNISSEVYVHLICPSLSYSSSTPRGVLKS